MKTILFDLDGTLLPMDNEAFTQFYLGLLGKKFMELGYDGKKAVKGVWKGLQYMVANDGTQSNEDTFWAGFYDVMKDDMIHEHAELNELLLSFYHNEFKEAVAATTPSQDAKQLIEKVKQAGYQVILATNPIFPEAAVTMRLSWIGLTKEDFKDVTTYETSHFCKPSPKYYQEILDRNHLVASDCMMIGNDVKEDIVPASSLGIKTFLVNEYQIGSCDDEIDTASGRLLDVLTLI